MQAGEETASDWPGPRGKVGVEYTERGLMWCCAGVEVLARARGGELLGSVGMNCVLCEGQNPASSENVAEEEKTKGG